MWELLRLAEQHSARVVFGGDTKHFRCMEACDALAAARKLASRAGQSVLQIGRRQTLQDDLPRTERTYDRSIGG